MDKLQVVHDDRDSAREMLFLVGGVALMLAGAGLILSNRNVRRYVSQIGVGDLVLAAFPDLDRYLRMRAM